MDGNYPDNVPHCKMGKSRSHTLQWLQARSVSSATSAVHVQNSVQMKFFLFSECMSKVTVLCNIHFNNDAWPKWVFGLAMRKWKKKSNSENVCSGKSPLWCCKATDAPSPPAARWSFWHHHLLCVPSQTCRKAKVGKKVWQGYRTDSFWGRGFFCNTREPWPADWARVDFPLNFQLSEKRSLDQAFRFPASCIVALNSNSQRT